MVWAHNLNLKAMLQDRLPVYAQMKSRNFVCAIQNTGIHEPSLNFDRLAPYP